MRRIGSILLLLAFGSLGSGALRYVHELAHAAEHAREAARGHAHAHAGESHDAGKSHDAGGSGGGPAPNHDHAPLGDPENCLTHAQLKLPMLQGGYTPPLVCLGLLVAFLAALPASAIRSRRPMLRLDSRAPPGGLLTPL